MLSFDELFNVLYRKRLQTHFDQSGLEFDEEEVESFVDEAMHAFTSKCVQEASLPYHDG